MQGLLVSLFLCAVSADSDAVSHTETTKSQQQPNPMGAHPFVDQHAVTAMRNLFTRPASMFASNKAILSLAQGKTTAGVSAPQTLAPFLPPFTPPASSQVASWSHYNLMMMSFWYRFKFGFGVFQAQTKDDGKWLTAAIHYFDLLANGYIAANMFLQLYSTLETLKTPVTDAKSKAAVYLAWVELWQAYSFLYWLFHQNTLDLLNIQQAVGVPVDEKVHAWHVGALPYIQNWAFMQLDVAVDIKRHNLYFDGKQFDMSKMNSALSLWYAKKFAWTVRSLNFAALAPEGEMKQYTGSFAPWLGYSLSHLGFMWAYFGSLSSTPVKPAGAHEQVLLQGDKSASTK